MDFVNRCAVIIRPTQVFLDWLNNTALKLGEEHAVDLSLAQIQSNSNVYLVDNDGVDEPEQIIAKIDDRFEEIFSLELAQWYDDENVWPEKRGLAEFWQFFQVEVCDTVIDTEAEYLQNTPITPFIP